MVALYSIKGRGGKNAVTKRHAKWLKFKMGHYIISYNQSLLPIVISILKVYSRRYRIEFHNRLLGILSNI